MRLIRRFILGLGLIAALFAVSVISATVTINLASRGRAVTIPDLKGMEIVPAIELLEEDELSLKISGKQYDELLPAGVILSHHPPAGSTVRKGRDVEAVISRGPKRVIIPDVRGDFFLRAQSILLENGLKIGNVSNIPSRRWARDTIISQTPLPPSRLDRNTTVDLLVSSGPPRMVLVMPDFIGRSLSDSVHTVQDAGMEIRQVKYQDYPGIKPGTVVDQRPPLGTPVNQSDSIELTVVQRLVPADRREVEYKLLSFYVPEGLISRMIRVVVETEKSSYELMSGERPPGDRIQSLVEVDGDTRVLIYIDGDLKDIRYF